MSRALKTCSVHEHRCGDFGDNGVSAVFVAYADLANAVTSRGPLRQVYRITESNQFSAVLTVNQTASLCEEKRKSLRGQKRAALGSCRTGLDRLGHGAFT
jgi:hypothetical protein